MASRLWPHSQLPGKVVDFVWNDMRPGGCLAMEPDPRFFERASGIVIARKWYPAEEQAKRVFRSPLISTANQTVDEILGYFSQVANKVTIYEGFNEVEEFPGQALTGDRLKIYGEWMLYVAEAFHRAGKRYLCGSFSVGNPVDIEGDWLSLAQAVKAADALGLHEYGTPTVLSGGGWHTLRYRRVVERLWRLGITPRIIITELGIDRVVEGGYRGWRKSGVSAQQYAEQLAAYDREIQQDDYVLGACIFTCGGNRDWVDFNIDGEGAIAEYIRTNTTGPATWPVGVTPAPQPEPPVPIPGGNMIIGAGLKKGESLIGPYLESEVYHFPGTDREVSMAVGEYGYATWSRKTNETAVHTNTGEVYRDYGNWREGKLVRVSGL